MKIYNKKKQIYLKASYILLFTYLFISYGSVSIAISVNEVPEQTFHGSNEADFMYINVDFNDIRGRNLWSKEAIYETGALGILKGYTDRSFKKDDNVTNEQALAVILRLAGFEAKAKEKADALNKKRAAGLRKNDPLSMWSDGYVEIAKSEKIITTEQYNDAFFPNSSGLGVNAFNRGNPVRRQDLAYWLALALKIAPVYDDNVLSNFNDWRGIDGAKIPYVEAVTKKGIMNGDGKGNFLPNASVKREQLAQVAMNLENELFDQIPIKKMYGTIEEIREEHDNSAVYGENITNYYIRNSNGGLDLIKKTKTAGNYLKNEINGNKIDKNEELLVFKDNSLHKSKALKVHDKIVYFVNKDNEVRFVKVVANIKDSTYYLVRLNNIDTAQNCIDLNELVKLEAINSKVDLVEEKNDLFKAQNNKLYTYSNDAAIVLDGRIVSEDYLKPYTFVIVELRDNVIVKINSAELINYNMESGVVSGVVKNVNIPLGYIEIIKNKSSGGHTLANYTFSKPEIIKDNQIADINNIEEGDTIFFKVDENNNITKINALNNSVRKRGRIVNILKNSLTIEFDDGTVNNFTDVNDDEGLKITSNGKMITYNDLKDGDQVLITMNVSDVPKLDEVSVEMFEYTIQKIYRAEIINVDVANNNLQVLNLQELKNDQWEYADIKGYANLSINPTCKFFDNKSEITIADINNNKKNSIAYIIMENYYGENKANRILIPEKDQQEVIFDDFVAEREGAEILLNNNYKTLILNDNALLIKDNRLVNPVSLNTDDNIKVIANIKDDQYYANVIKITENHADKNLDILRGQISEIEQGKSFAIKSYKKLDGLSWGQLVDEKIQIPFDSTTRILNENGLLNSRKFVAFGEDSFIDSFVYIVTDGIKAKIISVSNYFVDKINKGDVYKITNNPGSNELTLWHVRDYDASKENWNANDLEYNVKILPNTIIIKNGQLIGSEDIKMGDELEIYTSSSYVNPSTSTTNTANSSATGTKNTTSNVLNPIFILVNN